MRSLSFATVYLLIVTLSIPARSVPSAARATTETDTWKVTMEEGRGLLQQGFFNEAQLWFESAVKEAGSADEPSLLAASLTALGSVRTALGFYAEAEQLHRRAMGLMAPADALWATITANLAAAVHQQGNSRGARELYKQVHQHWLKAVGKEDSRVGAALADIAATFVSEGRYAEAAMLYSRSLKILDHSVGCKDRRTLAALTGYAATVTASQDYKRAERLWHQAFSCYETNAGPRHPHTLMVLISLASIHAEQKNGDCVALYERAVSGAAESLGPQHPTTLTARIGLSTCLATQRAHESAINHARLALMASQSVQAISYRRTEALALAAMSIAMFGRDQFSEADELCARALELCEKYPCGAAMRATLFRQRAAVLRKLGRMDDAIAAGTRSREELPAQPAVDVRDMQRLADAAKRH